MRLGYAIAMVSDMQRSISFYRDKLGLPLRFESPHWTEFATEGATLALHVGEGPTPPKERSESEPPGSCRPGLSVPDLDEFHQRMMAGGVTCLHEPTEVFGSRVAMYSDPDGLPISVGEERTGAS